jgi:ribose transport system ATP-binding protein
MASKNPDSGAILSIDGIVKSYGPTRAVAGISLKFDSSAINAVIGGNGAGKSTLMKMIVGETPADEGTISLGGQQVNTDGYGPALAHEVGIRIVHQELSLANSLTVAENFYIEQDTKGGLGLGWRKRSAEAAKAALRESFGPDAGISPSAKVSNLNAGERQMVEIARATSAPDLKVLILDEPTSALGPERVEYLGKLLRTLQDKGVIIILITHKMEELPKLTDRVVVMREGQLVEDTTTKATTTAKLLSLMLGGAQDAREKVKSSGKVNTALAGEVVLHVQQKQLHEIDLAQIEVKSGEVVGLLGLQDAGQEQFLRAIQDRKLPGKNKILKTAYITGDRKFDGIFSLWTSKRNLAATWISARGMFSFFTPKQIQNLAARWFDKLKLSIEAGDKTIGQLSGGMQQKVLFARGLSTDSKLLLLNDPTRGVDLATKIEMYQTIRESANEGKGVLWYSSEDSEIEFFDRTYVMRDGAVIAEFVNANSPVHTIKTAMFSQRETNKDEQTAKTLWAKVLKFLRNLVAQPWIFALIGVIAVLLLIDSKQDILTNTFGLGLILTLAPVLALTALSQNFIVAVGDIDLGIGQYMGLVVVIAATSLNTDPLIGIALLISVTILYPLIGWLLKVRQFPAVIATLAMSFVYSGLALTILPSVGGQVPSWLSGFSHLNIPGLPLPIVLLIVIGFAGYFVIDKTRIGTRIRALGSNEQALRDSGWNTTAVKVLAYGLAGITATLAGLMFAGIATAGDANSADGYTLMTIAAIVVGGSEFIGGRVSAVGAVLGAALLSLVGVLLGVFAIPSLFTAAAMGLLLIVVMGLRRLTREAERA